MNLYPPLIGAFPRGAGSRSHPRLDGDPHPRVSGRRPAFSPRRHPAARVGPLRGITSILAGEPREVYRVYGEEEFLACADLRDPTPLAPAARMQRHGLLVTASLAAACAFVYVAAAPWSRSGTPRSEMAARARPPRWPAREPPPAAAVGPTTAVPAVPVPAPRLSALASRALTRGHDPRKSDRRGQRPVSRSRRARTVVARAPAADEHASAQPQARVDSPASARPRSGPTRGPGEAASVEFGFEG